MRIPAAITFDCYGTLIDWEAGARQALAPIARRTRTDLDLLVWTWLQEDRASAERSNRDGFRPYSVHLVEALRQAASAMAIELEPGEDRALADSIRDWPAHRDGVAEVLSLLRGATVTAIVSNTEASILEASIRTVGVPVHRTFTAADAGAYKPSPDVFRFALAGLGLQTSDVLHVCASTYYDVEPATNLGIETVLVNRGYEAVDVRPHHEIFEFHALRDLLGI